MSSLVAVHLLKLGLCWALGMHLDVFSEMSKLSTQKFIGMISSAMGSMGRMLSSFDCFLQELFLFHMFLGS